MSPPASAKTKTAPTAVEVDALALKWEELQAKVLQAEVEYREALKTVTPQIAPMKEDLVGLVREFGSAHAEKSKRLNGVQWFLQATFGTSHTLDGAAVERFRLALVRAKQTRLLKRIFSKTIRWDLSPESDAIIRGSDLAKPLLALYSQCDVPKAKTPVLKVEKKEAAPAS